MQPAHPWPTDTFVKIKNLSVTGFIVKSGSLKVGRKFIPAYTIQDCHGRTRATYREEVEFIAPPDCECGQPMLVDETGKIVKTCNCTHESKEN